MVIRAVIQDHEYKLKDTYSIRQQAGAISLSNIDIKIEDAFVPAVFGSCQIFFDNVPFFFGFIQSIDLPEYNSGFEVKNYRLTIQSAESIFNYRIVSESYRNIYTHEIIRDLFEKYIAEDGFELGEISEGRYFENYDFSFIKLYEIIKELADDVGASFFITGNKVFNFIINNDYEEIQAPKHIKNLKLSESIGDLRTVQIISGASEETSIQTFVEKWKENQTAFTIGYQILEVHGATINGNQVQVGLMGVDDTDDEKTFLYSVFGNTITLNRNALITPEIDDDVHIVYTGYYDIIVEQTNQAIKARIAEISGTSGKIENLHNDETLKHYNDADNFAINLLNENSEPERTIDCICHTLEDTEFNKKWIFAHNELNILGKFMVVERTVSSFFDKWLIKVKLRNK